MVVNIRVSGFSIDGSAVVGMNEDVEKWNAAVRIRMFDSVFKVRGQGVEMLKEFFCMSAVDEMTKTIIYKVVVMFGLSGAAR